MFLRTRLVTALTTTLIMTLALSSIALADQTITSSGPLTNITVTSQLNCAVNHTGDTAGEFFGNTACGTFVVAGGTLFGPTSVPAGGSASPRTSWTQISQSAVLGTGTSADPFRVTTVADAGATGIRVTETDSYVTGQEAYRTDVALSNSGNASQSVIVYRAGDCFLQNSDSGFGRVDTVTGAVACTTSQTGGRIEQWFPITPGSHYYEAGFSEVWARIGAQLPFPDTCRCADNIDNGAGLSWSLTIPTGQSLTVSHFTTFSPLGLAPLSTTKTADAATATGGAADGYTITVSNPNATAATLNSITDTLPAGFSYTAGSTTGATTANPAVSSQTLTWAGPITVPASGNVTLHFRVTVATASGTYFNNATADAGAIPVAPSGPTAPIAVSGTGETPPPPPPSTPPPSTPPPGAPTSSRAIVTATSPSCGQAVINGDLVTPGLPMQIVVTPSAGGTPVVTNVTAAANQKVTATVALAGGGSFTAFIRGASNQVTISNTAIFTVAACAVATPSPTPTPTPTPTPSTSPVATPKPPSSPTAAPIANLPSTSTGGESGLPIVLALGVFALAAVTLRKLTSRT